MNLVDGGDWAGIHDVLSGPNLGCGDRSGCVEMLDMLTEEPACCSRSRECPCLNLELLWATCKRGQISLVHCLWYPVVCRKGMDGVFRETPSTRP